MHEGPSERADLLLKAFVAAGVKVEIPDDIRVALWEKFLFAVSWGGVGAVTRVPIGTLRALTETRQLREQGMREILAVAQAHKVSLSNDLAGRTLSFMDSLAPNGTTSLQRDIADGKPSELEAWNGAVVRLGRDVDVSTPLHAFLYHCLLPAELRARGEIQATVGSVPPVGIEPTTFHSGGERSIP